MSQIQELAPTHAPLHALGHALGHELRAGQMPGQAAGLANSPDLPEERAAQSSVEESSAGQDFEQNIFADAFTEAMISAMYDAQNASQTNTEAHGGVQKSGQAEEGTDRQKNGQPRDQEEPVGTNKDNGKAAGDSTDDSGADTLAKERDDGQDDEYDVEIFGKRARLSGDHLTELVEAGAQLVTHKDEITQAVRFMNAVKSDPALMAALQARMAGTGGQGHLAAEGMGAKQQGDPLAQLRAQVAADIIPVLMRQIQEHYKPFVESVNSFAAEHRREKAFGKYASDPDYAAVNDMMQHNIRAKVAEGVISYEQAAQIDAALKEDPNLYGEWFGKFKAVARGAAQGKRQGGAQPGAGKNSVGGMPGHMLTSMVGQGGRYMPPKLEGYGGVESASDGDKLKAAMARALHGDDEAFNALYDNQ